MIRILFLIFALVCTTADANNMLIRTASGTDEAWGFLKVGDTEGSTNYDMRCQPVSITGTVSHGYFYAQNSTTGTLSFYISVFNDNAGTLGSNVACSDEGTLPAAGGKTWNEVTFTPNLTLDDDYWICSYVPTGTFNYYFDPISDGVSTKYVTTATSCTVVSATYLFGSSRNASLKVTNYDAH